MSTRGLARTHDRDLGTTNPATTAVGPVVPGCGFARLRRGHVRGGRGTSLASVNAMLDLVYEYRVLLGKWSGTEVKLDGQELLIMKESEIMGVLTELPAAKKKAA